MTDARKTAAAKEKVAAATKDGKRVFNLDALRIARAEARAGTEAAVIVIGGEEFTLPAEMPLEFILASSEQRLAAAITALLGAEQHVRLMAVEPPLSGEDFAEIAKAAQAAYGVAEGE